MAFTEFYMQTTGNDLNSGSTNADSALYTSTGGNWDGVSVFTPTDGSTPASTISAGMWANVYNTGDGAARYIAQVVSVAAGVNGAVTFSTTAKYGTAPVSNSGSRNIKVGGAWASPATLTTRLTAVTAPASTRINIKAGTYSSLSSQNFGIGGGVGILVWYRGYKTTPGDLDNVSLSAVAAWVVGTDCPSFTWTGAGLTVSGKDSVVSGLGMTSASTTASVVSAAANGVIIRRCVATATGANALSIAVKMPNSLGVVELCYCKATSSAAVVSMTNASCEARGNYLEGGLNSVSVSSTGPWALYANIFDSPAGDAVVLGSNVALICVDNTFYNVGGHGISLPSTLATSVSICGNLFHTITTASKYAVNYSGSTDVGAVRLSSNSIYNCNAGTDSNGLTTGLGDMPAFDTTIEATDPLPLAASHVFQYMGQTGLGAGLPPIYQNTTANSLFDSNRAPGATQPNNVVVSTPRRVVVTTQTRRGPVRPVIVSGGGSTTYVPIPAPPRRIVYPARTNAARRVPFPIRAASIVPVRIPPRIVSRPVYYRRNAFNAILSAAVSVQTVLVKSERKVR